MTGRGGGRESCKSQEDPERIPWEPDVGRHGDECRGARE